MERSICARAGLELRVLDQGHGGRLEELDFLETIAELKRKRPDPWCRFLADHPELEPAEKKQADA